MERNGRAVPVFTQHHRVCPIGSNSVNNSKEHFQLFRWFIDQDLICSIDDHRIGKTPEPFEILETLC